MLRQLFAFLFLCGCAISASAATVSYSTSFDNPPFTVGNLNGKDGWVAQNQWQADGAGNISGTNGAFIRAHNLGVLGSTTVGETMRIKSSLTLGDYQTPNLAEMASFEQGLYAHVMSVDEGVADFGGDLSLGIFFNPTSGELELRANDGINETGTTNVPLGLATGLGGSSWMLETIYEKTGVDTWMVDATLTGPGGPYALSYSANSANGDLDTDPGGGGILGGIQALPSNGGSAGLPTPPYTPGTVHDFEIEVNNPVPEPTSLVLLALGFSGLAARRRS